MYSYHLSKTYIVCTYKHKFPHSYANYQQQMKKYQWLLSVGEIWYAMILGILDQGAGVLVVFDETPVDKTYGNSLETIQNMGKVVDALYHKAKKLT